jgi:crossover junction endodeoxyribonuclease RuvC
MYSDMVILGIDPGFRVSGFGVLGKTAAGIYLLDNGACVMRPSLSLAVRVKQFHDFFSEKIEKWSVTHIALEVPFLGKNAQNFLKLGYLRGIVYLLVARYNVELLEFSPREIKQAVTGFGGADKEQVARVIVRLFALGSFCSHFDVTDAIAVALTCFWRLPFLKSHNCPP